MAIARQRPGPGLIAHSERGVQYAAKAYRAALAGIGALASMSRKGDPFDNAPMESFFKTRSLSTMPTTPPTPKHAVTRSPSSKLV